MIKDMTYYMSLPYKMVIIKDISNGSYIVRFPDLPGCLTSGRTREEAIRNSLDAKENWLMAAIEDNIKIKEPTIEMVG